ncbi:hypothetical protein [Neobacillus jeddahensis]|uniref:hypothetical protein n=1 Tax=Neobacillus jeddahensis TaxID=1461580 RepID=UPI000B210A22|nr:hypothetical protein [Neobacillus jeddahensis]
MNQPSKEKRKLLLTLIRPVAERRQREMVEKENFNQTLRNVDSHKAIKQHTKK